MRTLRALIENHDTVWFYCRNDYLAKKFLEQCESEGFMTLNNQKPTALFHHKFYGVFDNLTMGYLSNMIWCLTLNRSNDNHLRIDYEKYISDEEDYICHRMKGKRIDYADWNLIAYSNGLRPKEFSELCSHFIDGQSFEEYNAYVFRCLIESNWHYSPEQAVERIEWEEHYISQSYLEKRPVSECAIEVGYGCG